MGKTYISKNKAAQALEIPAAVMDWNFNKAVKEGQLKKDVDYIESKSEDVYFTLSGLLWAVATCNGNFRGAVALAEKLASNERQLEAYKSLQLKNIPPMFVTFDVSKLLRSRVLRFIHPLNMLVIPWTADVFNPDSSISLIDSHP